MYIHHPLLWFWIIACVAFGCFVQARINKSSDGGGVGAFDVGPVFDFVSSLILWLFVFVVVFMSLAIRGCMGW